LLRTALARRLENGTTSAVARALARIHAPIAARALARPLIVPSGVAVVCVGGATLGGSGKTRVALACAREIAARGTCVALIGHAYRARPREARIVRPDDTLEEVGDEALACARSLPSPAFVVVGPTRQAAVDGAAAAGAAVVVLDGALQISPVPAALSILALDSERPWGAGDVAPAGDLRAPIDALARACDEAVLVDATPCAEDLARLRGVRFGLFSALARPARLVRALARQRDPRLVPAVTVALGDHGPMTAEAARRIHEADVDAWVATPKCATHFATRATRPLLVLEDRIALPTVLVSHMAVLRAIGYPRA
jgi:tetraacyldisaccharide 4'-kinase